MKTFLLVIVACLVLVSCSVQDAKPLLRGDYLGQALPDTTARLFAPGIVSDGLDNRDIAMLPDGSEIYYTSSYGPYQNSTIMVVRRQRDVWSTPEVAPFATSGSYPYYEPWMMPDGSALFFVTTQPLPSDPSRSDSNIWHMRRTNDGWGTPEPLPDLINTTFDEYYPSLTTDGTLYYTGVDPQTKREIIMRSRLIDGQYTTPEMLPPQVNCGRARFNAAIAADESFIIIPAIGVEPTLGGCDYYVSFRSADDSWSDPVNIGAPVSSEDRREWAASFSPDGRFLFFMSSRTDDASPPATRSHQAMLQAFNQPLNGNADIWWVSTDVIHRLR
jgi:hypothetical protein